MKKIIAILLSLALLLGCAAGLAEGAETKGQIDELKALGCDIVQGYYFSRPVPGGEYEEKYLG